MAQRSGSTELFGHKLNDRRKRKKMELYNRNMFRCFEHSWSHANQGCPVCLSRIGTGQGSPQSQQEFSFKDGDIAVLKASRDLLIKKCETLEAQLKAEKKRNLSLLKTLQQFLNIWAENYLDRSPED